MAGKVTKLQFQKRRSDRVNVYLDEEFAFGLPATEAAALRVGQYLNDTDIARLRERDAAEKAYDRAIHFLSYRPRSRAEVERNLAQAGTDEAAIQAAIERLTQQGLLDDAEFARFWVENRERFRPRGARALRQELRQKGVDEEITAAALSDLDPAANAYAAAQPRALRMAALAQSDARSFRQKLSSYLLRRGFDFEVVREIVTRLEGELLDEQSPLNDERRVTSDE
jgi:regulatory protein